MRLSRISFRLGLSALASLVALSAFAHEPRPGVGAWDGSRQQILVRCRAEESLGAREGFSSCGIGQAPERVWDGVREGRPTLKDKEDGMIVCVLKGSYLPEVVGLNDTALDAIRGKDEASKALAALVLEHRPCDEEPQSPAGREPLANGLVGDDRRDVGLDATDPDGVAEYA